MTTPPLRYLAATDVAACLPPLPEQIRLAERAMIGLATGAELPPKIGIHPRPMESFVHAMPAHLRGPAADGSMDLVGMKWIAGFPTNAAAGLPALHGLVVVNDPQTGIPLAVMDGGPITASRTAAVSGVAISRWSGPITDRRTTGRDHRGRRPGEGARARPRAPLAGRGARGPRPAAGPGRGARRRGRRHRQGSVPRARPRPRRRRWRTRTS